MSRLQIKSMHRSGGAGKHERFTYDFIVDGLSLAAALDVGDSVGCLDVLNRERNAQVVGALLRTGPADIPPDRVLIFVCPECAALGCGAFTARVEKTGDEFVWSDFQYETDYDPAMTRRHNGLGPFRFSAEQYQSVLGGCIPF